MKRSLLIILSVIVVLAILVLGSTWVLGTLTESGFRDFVEEMEENPSAQQVDLELPEYQRGFLKSSGSTSVSVVGVEHEAFFKHEIYHGPLAVTPSGVKAAHAYIVTTLDREKFPEDLRNSISEVYGETEPFTMTTTVPLVGDHVTEVEVAPVNHDEGTLAVRFAGADCRFEVSPDYESMDGIIQIGEFAMNESSEDSAFSLNVAESKLDVIGKEDESVSANGSFGAISLKGSGGEGPGVSVKVDSISMNTDYRATEGESSFMLGNGKINAPKVFVTIDEAGEIEITDLSASSEVKKESGLVVSSVTYEIGGVRETVSQDEEWGSYLEMLEQGAIAKGAITLSESAMESMVEFQKEMQAIQRRMMEDADAGKNAGGEQVQAMMQSYGKIVKTISEGSGLSFEMAAGEGDDGVRFDLDLTYTGEEPLTNQKTILELVQNIFIELGLNIPKSFVPVNEKTQQQLAIATASGSLVETPTSYQTKMVLEDGKLTTNGQPNLLFEQMAPMMMQPIPWDSMLSGTNQAEGNPEPDPGE